MDFTDDIKELITRRRRQILVHSTMYYRLNESVISDKQFDEWAYELVALQQTYPDIAKQCDYAKDFETFDGTTGFHLYDYDWAVATAKSLILYQKEGNN